MEPDDQLLEIGCGGGVAISLVCDRLVEGRITAIDRSPTMVARAAKRNEQHVESGKATVLLGELEDLELPARGFTKIFAINVNLFWVRSPAKELETIGRLLRSDGALYLFYAPPSDAKARAIAEQLLKVLPDASVETGKAGDTSLLALVVRI